MRKESVIMVYCFLATGFEEVEAISPVDMLKRAGVQVKTVGIGSKKITGAHGITVECDLDENEVELTGSLSAIILPGGMPGTVNLEKSKTVQAAIDFASENNKYICAICAAPSILGHKGLLKGKNATAFPGFEKDLEGATISDRHIAVDGNIITAKGAGVAIDFGLAIVSALTENETAEKIRSSIQCL